MEDDRHPDEIPMVREAMTPPKTMPIEEISPHPLNEEIYGDRADDELIGLIRKQGLIHPLLVTGGGMIISGHRRFDAVSKIGYRKVPVVISPLTDPLEIEETLIEANRQRLPSNEQQVREYAHLKKIEELRLKKLAEDMGTAEDTIPERPPVIESPDEPAPEVTEVSGEPTETIVVEEPSADEPAPKAEKQIIEESKERAAKKIGKSTDTLEKGLKVVEKIDEYKKEERHEEALDLQKKLNERSVSAAYKVVNPPDPNKPQPKKKFPLRKIKAFIAEIEEWKAEYPEHPAVAKLDEAIENIDEAVELYTRYR